MKREMKVSMKRENKLKKLNQKNLLPRKKNQMISPRTLKRAMRKQRLQEDVVVVEDAVDVGEEERKRKAKRERRRSPRLKSLLSNKSKRMITLTRDSHVNAEKVIVVVIAPALTVAIKERAMLRLNGVVKDALLADVEVTEMAGVEVISVAATAANKEVVVAVVVEKDSKEKRLPGNNNSRRSRNRKESKKKTEQISFL